MPLIHIDTIRSSSDAWYCVQTLMVGFDERERRILIKDIPERMIAVLINFGHAARLIQQTASIKRNKILIQDDSESVVGCAEQLELFNMLTERRKKLLMAMQGGGRYGDTYAKYLTTIMAIAKDWRIEVGLCSNSWCSNCRMQLEAFKEKCTLCGQPHEIKWQ